MRGPFDGRFGKALSYLQAPDLVDNLPSSTRYLTFTGFTDTGWFHEGGGTI